LLERCLSSFGYFIDALVAGAVFFKACQLIARDCYFYYRNGYDFSRNPDFGVYYWGTEDTIVDKSRRMGFAGRMLFAYPFQLVMSGPIGYACLVHLL
jgi:hypothetical protein